MNAVYGTYFVIWNGPLGNAAGNRVSGTCGSSPRAYVVFGCGRVANGPDRGGASMYAVMSLACCCSAAAKFGPGVPSSLTMRFERRFETVCPAPGW